jgi:hypothetical protein
VGCVPVATAHPLHDAGLLGRDRRQRLAEQLAMIERDRVIAQAASRSIKLVASPRPPRPLTRMIGCRLRKQMEEPR